MRPAAIPALPATATLRRQPRAPDMVIDWNAWRRGWRGAKRRGQQIEGPCPITGEGDNACHVNLQDDFAGCRKCGNGSGRLTGDQLLEHARAAGAVEVDLGAAASAQWESWTWITADGRERRQFRLPDGAKKWQTKGGPHPKPADLMYLPAGVPTGPGTVVYVCEGGSDADATVRLGLRAIGRTNARPSAESLGRLDSEALYRVWPDVDDDQAGFKQAVAWATAATHAGLSVEMIDPLKLRPDAPSGYDARNWIEELPDGATADTAESRISAAVVDVETIRARIPSIPSKAPAPELVKWTPGGQPVPIPRQHVELCDSEEAVAILVASLAGGRLRHDADSREWLIFTAPAGWMPVQAAVVEEHLTDCARASIGTERAGKVSMSPKTAGRRHVGRAVAGLLTGRVEIASRSVDWDAVPNVIGLPSGALLDVFTGHRRPSSVGELVRRRVPVEPATDSEFRASRFRAVLEHVIPDGAEREYLQRRLGAALADREGMDDLLWLFGPPGSGKGTFSVSLKATFGDYAGGVPINELLRGRNKGHSAWLARLAGRRLLFADDVPVGHQLDDSTINRLLGSEITAQHMRCAPFDFRLNAPILATSNAPPQIATLNVRRLKPIQCGESVTVGDPAVRASMSTPAEIAACLRWLIDGARLWRTDGCPSPDTCRERAADAAAESPVAAFTVQFDPGVRYRPEDVYRAWCEFKRGLGHRHVDSQTALTGMLKAAGWQTKKSNSVRYLIAPFQIDKGSGRVGFPIDRTYADRTYEGTTENPTLPDPAPAGETPANTSEQPSDFPAFGLGRADGADQSAGGGGEVAENSDRPPPAPAAPNHQPTPAELEARWLVHQMEKLLADPVAPLPDRCYLCGIQPPVMDPATGERALVETQHAGRLCHRCCANYNTMLRLTPPGTSDAELHAEWRSAATRCIDRDRGES